MASHAGDLSAPRQRVRAATASLIKPGSTDLQTVVRCMREIDTVLRSGSHSDQNDAASEFCEGPDRVADKSALRWCATALQRGILDGLNPTAVKHATFTVGVTLQILISVSGADHRQQFGHITRGGEHEEWPTRGSMVVTQGWRPDMWTPTGILEPLLHLTQAQQAGPQIRLRALQLAGSVARDSAALTAMLKGGWLEVSHKALEHRPRPDHTEEETKEFIYQRETWQFLQETIGKVKEAVEVPVASTGEEDATSTLSDDSEPCTTRLALEAAERSSTTDDFPKGETQWHGRMVRIKNLKKRPSLNGTLGFAQGPGGSDGRVAVLVNPLGSTGDSEEASEMLADSTSTTSTTNILAIHRSNLSVFDGPGLTRRDVASGGGAAEGVASVSAGQAAEKVPEDMLLFTSQSEGGITEPDVKLQEERDTYDTILELMDKADSYRDANNHDDAVASCLDAKATSVEHLDNKSLVRAFVLHRLFKAHLNRAEAALKRDSRDSLDLETIQSARSDALRSAGDAMDLLEFRALGKFRDGRLGERPPNSLLELTDDETRFVLKICEHGRVEDVKFVCGASLAVALAEEAFVPALAEVVRTKARTTSENGQGNESEIELDDQSSKEKIYFETLCWRRMSTALRAVDAQRKLGALAVRWRPRGIVSDAFGDVPGPTEFVGSARHAGYAVPAVLPVGTHTAYRVARGQFLRKYLDLLVARFVGVEKGDDVRLYTHLDSKTPVVSARVAAVSAALRVEPLLLQFSVGGFRDLMVLDEEFVVEVGGEEDIEARRQRNSAEKATNAE